MAAALLSLAGCQDESLVEGGGKPANPAQPGDEITFGTGLTDNKQVRTVYGAPVDENQDGRYDYYPVYWESGDQIAIFCPQSAQKQLVTYTVEPNPEKPETSQSVTRVGDVGLQWSSEDDEHRFYGFYPASAVKAADTNGLITSNIPQYQMPVAWTKRANDHGGETYRGTANTDYASMVAYNKVNRSDIAEGVDVPLEFVPLTTILEIVVHGPENATTPIVVTGINVEPVDRNDNIILNGDYTCNITKKDASGALALDCRASGDFDIVRDVVTVPAYNRTETADVPRGYIKLEQYDELIVHAFILPQTGQDIQPEALKITVATSNGGARVKTLKTDDIVQHKVNRIDLPAYEPSTEPNYWLSSLDPNIYLKELSIPGSIHSAMSAVNRSNVHWQETDLATQFDDGIRGFLFQVSAKNDNTIWDLGVTIDWSETPEWRLCVNNSDRENLRDLRTSLLTIAQKLEAAGGNEFAFVQITPSRKGTDHATLYQDYNSWTKCWMKAIEACVREYVNDAELGQYIYQGTISPTTKIRDVAGKIILKFNVNTDDNMGDMMAADAGLPALFSTWNGAYQENGVPLRWGSSNSTASTDLTWFYQEVTTIGEDGQVADLATKQGYIRNLFQKSVDYYLNPAGEASSYWFFNDVSGNVGTGGNPTTQGILNGIKAMNDFVVEELNNRGQNAALGLIYMSYANRNGNVGQEYKCGELIQSIIDNNFRFQLRKAGGSSSQAQHYNATYQNGGDAISH